MKTPGVVQLLVSLCLTGIAFGQASAQKGAKTENSSKGWHTAMDQIYMDESHCLTSPEIRSDKDSAISCYCRDAIEDARYVHFTYLLSWKDRNLNGTFLTLQQHAVETCGQSYDLISDATETKDWTWNGPEVIRTYPPDEVIQRISPEVRDGKPFGRWVPFTVQLVYHDDHGRVTRTENYASRELFPILPK